MGSSSSKIFEKYNLPEKVSKDDYKRELGLFREAVGLFSSKLIDYFVHQKMENILLSPLSLDLALLMVADGSDGETLKEFQKLLCVEEFNSYKEVYILVYIFIFI